MRHHLSPQIIHPPHKTKLPHHIYAFLFIKISIQILSANSSQFNFQKLHRKTNLAPKINGIPLICLALHKRRKERMINLILKFFILFAILMTFFVDYQPNQQENTRKFCQQNTRKCDVISMLSFPFPSPAFQ